MPRSGGDGTSAKAISSLLGAGGTGALVRSLAEDETIMGLLLPMNIDDLRFLH